MMKNPFKPPFEAYSGEKPFIFVSYDHSDIELVYPIIENLYNNGMLMWYDEGIPVSTRWEKIITNFINRCSCFLVFISKNSINSEHVTDEIFYAIDRYKKNEIQFVPIYLDNTPLPDELKLSIGRIQALNKSTMDEEIFFKKLNGQLYSFLDSIPPKVRQELNSASRIIKKEQLSISKERMEIEKELLEKEKSLFEKRVEFKKVKLELELKYLEEEKIRFAKIAKGKADEKLRHGIISGSTNDEDFNYKLKIIMMGDGTVGKTSLTEYYINGIFKTDIKRTIGVEFYIKNLEIENTKIRLTIWDIGGQKGFRFLIPSYCLGSNGAILIYDTTRASSIEDLESWISIFRSKTSEDTPILLVGNKIDLVKEQVISREKGLKIMENHKLSALLECSAKTGKNVEEIFTLLTQMILERDYGIKIPE